jgi:hypothetical protein
MATRPRPELAGLRIADPPDRWQALGFAVEQGQLELGGVAVELGGVAGEQGGVSVELARPAAGHGGAGQADRDPPAQAGITGWTLRNVDEVDDIDGLTTTTTAGVPPAADVPATARDHPNGVTAIDHVVVTTPDFDRTVEALEGAGMSLSRIRDAGSFRQGFHRLGPAILELVEARGAPPGPASFWGLVFIIDDLEALSAQISPHLGEIRPAVQPGRHIATLDRSAGLSPRVAFMDPDQPRAPAE